MSERVTNRPVRAPMAVVFLEYFPWSSGIRYNRLHKKLARIEPSNPLAANCVWGEN